MSDIVLTLADVCEPVLSLHPELTIALINNVCSGKPIVCSPDINNGQVELLTMKDGHWIRNLATERGMWAIVEPIWVKQLAEWIGKRRVLEVGCGAGFLARELRLLDVRMFAVDNFSMNYEHKKMEPVTTIVRSDGIEAAKKTIAEVLIISWPVQNCEFAVGVLRAWGRDRPVVYIGELWGGCTANDDFFEAFRVETQGEAAIHLPIWEGMHDTLSIGYYNGR